MMSDLFSQGVAQLNLFDGNAPRANSEALMSLMNEINQQECQMKRAMFSPRYTTRLTDVPVARAN